MNFYQMLMAAQQGAQNPATIQDTAARLAAVGDPNAVAPLFEDANSWSPTKFDTMFDGAQLTPMQPPTFAGAPAGGLGQSVPALSMTAPQAGAAIPGAVRPTASGMAAAAPTAPGLTPQQMQELFGLATQPGGSKTPPMVGTPSAARPTPFNANMGQVSAPGVSPLTARPTLAQLIFGK